METEKRVKKIKNSGGIVSGWRNFESPANDLINISNCGLKEICGEDEEFHYPTIETFY